MLTIAAMGKLSQCVLRPVTVRSDLLTISSHSQWTAVKHHSLKVTQNALFYVHFFKKTFRGRGTVLQQPTADVLYCEILLSCCTALCFVDITAVITINLQRCFTCHVELRSVFDYWSAFTYP